MNINYKDYFGKIHSLKKNLKYPVLLLYILTSVQYRL